MTANKRLQAVNALWPAFTCITFIGVKLHWSGPLRAGTGVSTRPQETEVTAHILTRVGYCRRKSNTVRYCSELKFCWKVYRQTPYIPFRPTS